MSCTSLEMRCDGESAIEMQVGKAADDRAVAGRPQGSVQPVHATAQHPADRQPHGAGRRAACRGQAIHGRRRQVRPERDAFRRDGPHAVPLVVRRVGGLHLLPLGRPRAFPPRGPPAPTQPGCPRR